MGPSKCPVCEGPMKPLFQSFYCPDEDKPDHGKSAENSPAAQYARGWLTMEQFEKLWRAANGYN